MNILNNVGPSALPCGTPSQTFSHEENVSPILTLCQLYLWLLVWPLRGGVVTSKAFDKSIDTIPTSRPSSRIYLQSSITLSDDDSQL